MKSCSSTPGNRRRERGEDNAEDEAQSPGLPGDRVLGDGDQPLEIHHQDGEDRAELDQHLEHPAGAVEAEEVAGEQDVGGGGDRQEFGKAFDDP